jgi:hypothetical protein
MKTDINLADMDRIYDGNLTREDFKIPYDSLGGDFGACLLDNGNGAKFVATENEGFCDVAQTVGFKLPDGPS